MKHAKTGAGLTPRQERFVQAYQALGNGAEAYAQLSPNSNRNSAKACATRLLAKPHIRARLNELRAREDPLTNIAELRAKAVAEQDEAMRMAAASDNPSAYSAAAERKHKLLGLIVDRQQSHLIAEVSVRPSDDPPDVASIWLEALELSRKS